MSKSETDVYDATTVFNALMALFYSHKINLGLDTNASRKFSKKPNFRFDPSLLDASNPEQSIRQMAEILFNFSQLSLSHNTDMNDQGRAQLQSYKPLVLKDVLNLNDKTTLEDFVQTVLKFKEQDEKSGA